MTTLGSICTGAGGMDIGLEAAGLTVAWQSEIEPHASAVLAKRWPGTPNLGDVRALASRPPEPVEVLAGGIPCQGHSVAGLRKGGEDERNLWPHVASLIGAWLPQDRPRIVIIENVTGLLTSDDGAFMAGLLRDLDRLGYETEWDCATACSVGLPHRRDRVFIVARRDGKRTWQAGPGWRNAEVRVRTVTKWPRAGRWDGALWARQPRWPHDASCYLRAPAEHWATASVADARSSARGTTTTGVMNPGESLTDMIRHWPTAAGRDGRDGRDGRASEATHDGNARPLNEVACHWPTATRHDDRSPEPHKSVASAQAFDLKDYAAHWPTPDAAQGGTNQSPSPGATVRPTLSHMLRHQIDDGTRLLNTEWAECLMGWPMGWTDLGCDEPRQMPAPAPRIEGMDAASPQFAFEPPRTVHGRRGDKRAARLRAIGNGVVPEVVKRIAEAVMGIRAEATQ